MKRFGLFIVLQFTLSCAAIAGAAETKPPWQREWEKVIEGAKKEGEVRLWGEQEITHADIIAAFNKEYPFIKAVTVSGRVGDLMPRIIAERRAGKFLADIYSGGLGGRSFFDFHHIRGNHMLYILEAGLELTDVKWIEITDRMSSEFRAQQYEVMKAGEGDVTLVTGDTQRYEDAGFHVLQLPRLPMINGPTLTTTVTALNKYDRFGERLVLAQVLGIHFGRTRKAETEKILEGLKKREPEARGVSYNNVAKLAIKPYPDIQAVRLCCLKAPEAKDLSPMSMWDLHFLRQLDNSGFIDRLYEEK